MIQFRGDSFLTSLTFSAGYSFKQVIPSDKWKIANIIPNHKRETKNLVKNYRPISLLPVFSKISQRLLSYSFFHFYHNNFFLNFEEFSYQMTLVDPNFFPYCMKLSHCSIVINPLMWKQYSWMYWKPLKKFFTNDCNLNWNLIE